MNEKELFDAGCFLPEWSTEEVEHKSLSIAYGRKPKDLQTLQDELMQIKDEIQEIQARQWHLARLIHFRKNELAEE